MKEISKKSITKALSKAMHPEINYSLIKLGMIDNIKVDKKISLDLKLPFLEVPIKEDLVNIIKKNLRELGNFKIEIKIKKMSEKEKEKFMRLARKGWIF